MNRRHDKALPADAPLATYRLIRQFVFIAVAGLLINWMMLGTSVVRTTQMRPALLEGDRVLIRRPSALPLVRNLLPPSRGTVVAFARPHQQSDRSCLRVLGIPGDTIEIRDGQYVLATDTALPPPLHPDSILPAEYSPRDFMAPWTLPKTGHTLHLDSLDQRDFIFAASMRAQEYPRRTHDVAVTLLIDGTPSNEYIITNFLLYDGAFDSIPDSRDFDWFFWDRLRSNLHYSLENREVRLRFSLLENGRKIETYRVGKPFLFLMADNWNNGLDSRFFGPVCVNRIQGTIPLLLWSSERSHGIRRIPKRKSRTAAAFQ